MEPTRTVLRVVAQNGVQEEPDSSLEWVYRKYSPYVASIALRLVGRDGDVDDIVQEVFLQALKGLAQLREPGALKGWLATVTVRVSRRRLQLRKLKSWVGLDEDTGYESVASPSASPEQRALLSRVYRVLDEISVDQRLAWTLRMVEGEQLEAVASLCGCSLATAKRRIAAAQDHIERNLCDE